MLGFGKRKLKEEEKKDEAKADATGEACEAGEAQVAPDPQVPPVQPGETGEKPAEPEQSAEPEKPAEPKNPAEPDWKDLYARLLADFDNYKKRAARDREDTYRFAEADILKDVLPAVDNLALALDNAKGQANEPFVKGVRLVYDALLKSLADHGAEPFDSLGKPLDTERMEAIAQLPSADVAEGLVSNEVKRGWMLKDKVLRAAQVVVSAGAPDGADGAKPQGDGKPAEAPEDANG